MLKNKLTGFTLIELVITMVVLAIISGGSAFLVAKGAQAFWTGRNVIDAEWQARVVLEKMSRELRNVRSINDIVTADSNTISFIDNGGNQITYYLNGSQLMRKSPFNGTGQVLADGVSLTLTYYNGSNTQLSNPVAVTNSIRYIVLTASITYGGGGTFNIITGVYPWNLH